MELFAVGERYDLVERAVSEEDRGRRDTHLVEGCDGEGIKIGAFSSDLHRGIDEPVRELRMDVSFCGLVY